MRCARVLGDLGVDDDVGELQPAAGAQDAVDLVEHRVLVGHEVDHAVGDHDVDAAVLERQRSRSATRAARRCRGPSPARSRGRARASTGSCRRRSRGPSGPVIWAAISRSVPAPQPRSSTTDARLDAAEHPVVGHAGEALDGGVGDARELGLGVAELLRPRAAGGEDELLRRRRWRRRCRSSGSPRAGRRRRRRDVELCSCGSRLEGCRRVAIPASPPRGAARRGRRPAAAGPPRARRRRTGRGSRRRPRDRRAARRAGAASSSIGIERAPSMWPASNSSLGRTSTSTTSPRRSRSISSSRPIASTSSPR